MAFTRKILSQEELRDSFDFYRLDQWVENPVVVDDLTGARLYRVRERAVNDTIDTVYFVENGNYTKLHRDRNLWSWMPDDEMSRHQIRRRHKRICEALALLYSNGISLQAYSRRKDMALQNRLLGLAGAVVYLAVVLALVRLIAVGVV